VVALLALEAIGWHIFIGAVFTGDYNYVGKVNI
jgi:hypothetical protein